MAVRHLKFPFLFMISLGFIRAPACFSGDYGAAFLEIGIGGRALSMGGAFCSVADDGSAFYWNPAGSCLLEERRISGMYGQQFGSLKNPLGVYHHIGISQPLTGNAAISINWIRLSIDDIPEYPELKGDSYLDRLFDLSLRPSGEPIRYFSDTEDAFVFTFAKMMKQEFNMGWNYQNVRIEMPIGVNFKWIRQTLHTYQANGLGIDLGTMMRIHISDIFMTDKYGIFSLGINLQDLTTTHIKWNTQHNDGVPMNVKWGISYMQPLPFINHAILMAFDWDSRWKHQNHFGFAYTAWNHLGLRLGKEGRHFSCGAGFTIWKFCVDYAFITHEVDNLHRISCELKL
jgi:hypothetical protein